MQHRSIGYRLWKYLNKKYGFSNDASALENRISGGGGVTNDCGGYRITGNNNRIIVVENGVERELGRNEKIDGLNVKILSNNNTIKIIMPSFFADSFVDIQPSASVEIVFDKVIKFCGRITAWGGENQKLTFGSGTEVTGWISIALPEANASITLGEDCLLAAGSCFWGGDAHTIVDINTQKSINKVKQGIEIGNHVWIGEGCSILKNAYIPSNCIVGTKSVVTSKINQEYSVIAGNPAKVVKSGVSWDKRTPSLYYSEVEQ